MPKQTPQYKPRIKVFLLQGKVLTPMIALKRWGCFRLAVYIQRLRKDGFKITTTMKYHKGKQYAEYRHII